MEQSYYDTVTAMEKDGIDPEYMDGWMSGYLHNPIREEQRVTDAYQAGFDDGQEKKTDNMNNWKK